MDGIPILVPDVRAYLSEHFFHLTLRDDLPHELESMIGESCGPGSHVDATRLNLSNYAWGHYGDLDPTTSSTPGTTAGSSYDHPTGSVAEALNRGLELTTNGFTSPVLDAGCSVGRATFELAQTVDGLVVGVDLNYSMLRLAHHVLRYQEVRYPHRRGGLIYEDRRFPVPLDNTDRVDFWACDSTALPFRDGTFGGAVALNLLDCVASPWDLLGSLRSSLRTDAKLILTCPYDWSTSATDPQAWIGGHSPRSPGAGRSAKVLRALLTPGAHPVSIDGLRLSAELENIPWHVRLHDRSTVTYQLHLVIATRV